MSDTPDLDLTKRETHFAFGKNWASYAELISPREVERAVEGVSRLVGDSLEGKRFLDIGCGSGLHSLAALRLGASEVVAVDLDPDSVATSRKVLAAHVDAGRARIDECSVFELSSGTYGLFDVVYSWGVLHHTGDMYRAVRNAAQMVAPGGMFAFALYRETSLCGFWKAEKRWYASASPALQRAARAAYVAAFRTAMLLQRRSFRQYVSEYPDKNRGMDFYHDVHDWMGGWPYESISPRDADAFMTKLGFRKVRDFAVPYRPSGLFGSGCDEFVYQRSGVT